MLTVFFKVQGGPMIGMGHIYRSLCLADAMRESGMYVAAFFCNDDAASLHLIDKRGYRFLIYPEGDANAEDILKKTLVEDEANVLIFDQPISEPSLVQQIKCEKSRPYLVALDYFDLEEDGIDLIVNLYNHNLVLQCPLPAHVNYIEGVDYAIIRPEFDCYAKRPKEIREKSSDMLISFGGSDPRNNTVRVLNEVLNAESNLHFHVVIGPNFGANGWLKKKISSKGNQVTFYQSPDNVAELMSLCDFGFVGAGTMMLEMLSVGTPAIVLPQNENETRFGAFLADRNVVKMPGYAENLTEGKLAEIAAGLAIDSAERKHMSLAGKRVVDGKGRYRIVNLIKQRCGREKTSCYRSW